MPERSREELIVRLKEKNAELAAVEQRLLASEEEVRSLKVELAGASSSTSDGLAAVEEVTPLLFPKG